MLALFDIRLSSHNDVVALIFFNTDSGITGTKTIHQIVDWIKCSGPYKITTKIQVTFRNVGPLALRAGPRFQVV